MRLIDADAVKGAFLDRYVIYDDTLKIIDSVPTVDAVPVVRCKDCKHNSLNRFSGNALCDLGMNLFHPYDFCSQADRSEG